MSVKWTLTGMINFAQLYQNFKYLLDLSRYGAHYHTLSLQPVEILAFAAAKSKRYIVPVTLGILK